MSQLGEIVTRLASGRTYFDRLLTQQTYKAAGHLDAALEEERDFGSNPGALRMLTHVPAALAPQAALVVVLHGCGQTAGDYADGAGWLDLSDRYGFVLLAPEQQASNNPNTCFNWFQPGDTTRGMGEAESVCQMIERTVAAHGLDRRRIFVTGLSAGGAMTAALLALYPDVFAAGAIIAGLPFRAARNVPEAFEAMMQVRAQSAQAQGELVRAGTPTPPVWPRVSIWQGDADRTVAPGNADELVKQWTDVHGLDREPTSSEARPGVRHRIWQLGGTVVVEDVRLAGLGHGTPVATTPAEGPRPYMIDVGVPSSEHIASFFGLIAGGAPIMPRSAKGKPQSGKAVPKPADFVAKVLRSVKLPRL